MIIANYAALLALLFVYLSVRTIAVRKKLGIGVGDGGNPALLRLMRVHANFAEYVPLALLIVAFCEWQKAPELFVHALGMMLLVGRLLHAWGVSQLNEKLIFRQIGMALTFSCLLMGALYWVVEWLV